MNEIGGYFELELNQGNEYHSGAIKLNLGRTAFEYVLRAKKVQRVFIPYYTCDVMLDPLKRTGVKYEFYSIDENLEPVFNYESLHVTDHFLYTNYFGLKDNFIKRIASHVNNLIIDNSQAFFSEPITNVDTFYSPRKFFGVPDGGYLYTDRKVDFVLDQDISWQRMNHLLIRIDISPQDGYTTFLQSNNVMIDQPIKTMSKLTQTLLFNVNYSKAKTKRRENFMFLHERLEERNDYKLDIAVIDTPMVYPFLCSNGEKQKKKLIENKVFVATYWGNVNIIPESSSYETYLTKNLVPLPIDQRYDISDMQRIIDIIKE